MKILLATDGSESAKAARNFTAQFPFPEKSEIILLTVVEQDKTHREDTNLLEQDHQSVLREVEKTARETGEELVRNESVCFPDSGLQLSTVVRTGHPAEEIVEAAEELQVDVVIIGSHGLTGMKHFLLGSVSEKVLNHAPCSVIIVRKQGSDDTCNDRANSNGTREKADFVWNVLLAYDGSETARKAVSLCASIPFDASARIEGLTVIPLVKIYRQDLQLHMQKIIRQRKRIAEQVIHNAFQGEKWNTPNVRTQIRECTDAGQGILAAVKELGTNLIFIGYKGKSAIKKFFLGSETDYVAKNAECAVWVVREEKHEN